MEPILGTDLRYKYNLCTYKVKPPAVNLLHYLLIEKKQDAPASLAVTAPSCELDNRSACSIHHCLSTWLTVSVLLTILKTSLRRPQSFSFMTTTLHFLSLLVNKTKNYKYKY